MCAPFCSHCAREDAYRLMNTEGCDSRICICVADKAHNSAVLSCSIKKIEAIRVMRRLHNKHTPTKENRTSSLPDSRHK